MAKATAAIGLGASILTFVEYSLQVSTRIREYRSASEELPGVFQDIACQLPLMTEIMARIKSRCDCNLMTAESQNNVTRVVDGCVRHIRVLNVLLEKLLPNSTDSSLRRARKVLASIRKQREMEIAWQNLRGYSQTLSLNFSEISATLMGAAYPIEESYYEVPSQRVDRFIERKEIPKNIEHVLARTNQCSPRAKIVVLLGMGR